jgi:hypothetical protein
MKNFETFCQIMTEAMNTEAMKHGDVLVSLSEVKSMPEAYAAYTMTVHIAQSAI